MEIPFKPLGKFGWTERDYFLICPQELVLGHPTIILNFLIFQNFSNNDGSIEGTSNSTSPIYTTNTQQLNNNNDSSLITSVLQEIQLPHDGSDDSSFAPQIDNQS